MAFIKISKPTYPACFFFLLNFVVKKTQIIVIFFFFFKKLKNKICDHVKIDFNIKKQKEIGTHS